MITRKDLVEALRVLHTDDEITLLKQTKKRLEVYFFTKNSPRNGLLVIPLKTPTNDTTRTTNKKDPTNLS